jgi:diguanylate cyclase (GGDEF)-like protein
VSADSFNEALRDGHPRPGRTLRALDPRRGVWPLRRASEDPKTIARTFALLFALGAVLVLASFALPAGDGRDTVGLAIPAGVALLVALALVLVGERMPAPALRVVPAIGTALAAVAAYEGGPVALGAYGTLLFLVALAAAYFLPAKVALLHVLGALIAYTVVLLLLPEHPAQGLYVAVAGGTLALAGTLLVALRRREERLVSRLERAARTDVVTGLLNRAALEERIEQELQRAARNARPLSLVVLDLDRFKRVNDSLGHQEGDAALALAGEAVAGAARGLDTVARLGGDEFAVLLPETPAGDAFEVAERMRRALERAFTGTEADLTGSFGVAGFPEHAATASVLLGRADRALYDAKSLGRNRTSVHPPIAPRRVRVGRRPDGISYVDAEVATLLSLAGEVERRKGSTEDTWRAGLVADGLARTLGLRGSRAERVQLAARLRDVGQIGFPEPLLASEQPLAEEQWRAIQRHPEIGARMLATAHLGDISAWVLCHHERLDGTGYPRGLSDEEIPLEARILTVADAYAAMQAERHWRHRLPPSRAQAELLGNAGTQFDPDVVEALVSLAGEPA